MDHLERKLLFLWGDKEYEGLFTFVADRLEEKFSKEVAITILKEPVFAHKDGYNFDEYSAVIVPFLDFSCSVFIGLDLLYKLRMECQAYKPVPFFLCKSSLFLPNFLRPENLCLPLLKWLIGVPRFGNVHKAILFAEVLFDNDKNDLSNFTSLSSERDFFSQLAFSITKLTDKYSKSNLPQLRKRFYESFVLFHEFGFCQDGETEKGSRLKKKIGETKLNQLKYLQRENYQYAQELTKYFDRSRLLSLSRNTDLETYELLELADYIHCMLNGRRPPEKAGSHAIPLETFSAPPPFPLQEIIDAKEEIQKALKQNEKESDQGEVETRKLRLLLVDNRRDKLIGSDGKSFTGPLMKIRENFDLTDILEFRWPGNNKRHEDTTGPQEVVRFHFTEFKNALNAKDTNQMEDFVKEVSDANFVLLDFFLDEDNTYLAYDFIRDMDKAKLHFGYSHTTWYFITSAMHDAALKYSQSGLLAEHYESAVVCGGDDPTNNLRQIIFVYKLLTFIQSRVRSLGRLRDAVLQSRPVNCVEENCDQKKAKECLVSAQSIFRKYLAEFEEATKIFPNLEYEDENHKLKGIVELLDSTINKFNWLPEADWHDIQRQIRYIDIKLEDYSKDHAGKELKFKCRFMTTELESRQEVY